MDIKTTLGFQLKHARSMTDSVIRTFTTRDQWLYQSHPTANNAIWIVAHLGLADNFMMSFFRPESAIELDGGQPRYWFNSTPSALDSDNLETDVVLDYFNDRRENLYRIFADVSLDELSQPVPPDTPFSKFPNFGQIFAFNFFHEGMHLGQLTVAHRGLGNPPLHVPKSEITEA